MTGDEAFKRLRPILRESFPDRAEKMINEVSSLLYDSKGGWICMLCRRPSSMAVERIGIDGNRARFLRPGYRRPAEDPTKMICSRCLSHGILTNPNEFSKSRLLADIRRAIEASPRPRADEMIALISALFDNVTWRRVELANCTVCEQEALDVALAEYDRLIGICRDCALSAKLDLDRRR